MNQPCWLVDHNTIWLDWMKKKRHEKLKQVDHIKMVACDQHSDTLVSLFSLLSSNERMDYSNKDPVNRISKNF